MHAVRPNIPAPASRQPLSAAHVLLVEDDSEISRMVTDVLRESGFEASSVASGGDMDTILSRSNVDLIVLDIMLPGEDGLSICRRLRVTSGIPIIMLTALKEDIDRIVGLEIGADDYVTKPFNSRELVARIRSILRRVHSEQALPGSRLRRLGFAGWTVDPAARQIHSPDGVRIAMTSAEFDLLVAFCQNGGRILSREQLLDLTHAGLAGPIERSIDVHISRIRQKIEPDPHHPTLIKTVRLGGYIFTPTVGYV